MKTPLYIFVVVIAITLSGLSSYAYFTYIPKKIEQKIIDNFNAFGFENLKFGEISHKNGEIIFSDISLDKQSFSTIREISVKFSLLNFLLSPDYAQEISVKNLDLTGELSQSLSLSISGWVDNKNFLQKLRSIPATIINIESSNINILSEHLGGLKIGYDAQIQLSKLEDIIIKGRANSTQRNLKFNTKLNGTISPSDKLSLVTEIEQLSMSYNDLKIRRGSAKLDFVNNIKDMTYDMSIESEIASVNWGGLPLRGVHAVLEKGNNNNYNLMADGKVFGIEEIEWKTHINKIDDIIETNSTITPNSLGALVSFLRKNNQLDLKEDFPEIVSNLKDPILSISTTNNNGTIGGELTASFQSPDFEVGGGFAYNNENDRVAGIISVTDTKIEHKSTHKEGYTPTKFMLSSSGEFAINKIKNKPYLTWSMRTKVKDGVIDYGSFKIPNITSEFTLNSKSKKITKEHLSFKLPLKRGIPQRGKINLNLSKRENTPLVKSIQLDVYGGRIKTQYPITNEGNLTSKNKLIVSDINIEKLFRDSGFKDIVITGQLGGVIPLHIDKDKMTVSGGILQSQGGGIIKMPKDVIAGLFPGGSKRMHRIRASLENYYYEYFEIRLDGDLNGRAMMTLNARGYDTTKRNEDPVDLNLQIETQISILFKNLLQ
ncbi:MAG: intermembrane phospholipid transport protein YdbH family protein [Alphaproteobacteria bacterium]